MTGLEFNEQCSEVTLDVRSSICRLEKWLDWNGWRGYDPYDIKEASLYCSFTRDPYEYNLLSGNRIATKGMRFLYRKVRRFTLNAHQYHPLGLYRAFGVKKRINAKAMGLLARGYLSRYCETLDNSYIVKAEACLKWLCDNRSPQKRFHCWGYPFDWQSLILIPKQTPSAVVSSIVGDAFWAAYKVTGKSEYLEICNSICCFFQSELRIRRIAPETICYSYTPIDDFYVHNSNLFVAEFLARIGGELSVESFNDHARQAANYALGEANDDGSLNYWGSHQTGVTRSIDHYHSGFEIRSLHGLWQTLGDERIHEAMLQYYHFYRSRLIDDHGEFAVPRFSPDSVNPVDVHACAESLLCNATLAGEVDEAQQVLEKLAKWITAHMQHSQGWFVAKRYIHDGKDRVVKIPYLRWGQAWMLYALSTASLRLSANTS